MAIEDDIITARNAGVTRCGLSAQRSPTLSELAREFGLYDDPAIFKEINEAEAQRLAVLVLCQNLAYNSEIMPVNQAEQMAVQFLAQFGPDARFFTNGTWHLDVIERQNGVRRGASWDPATAATFDTGLLILGRTCCGCLWVEDED
jgi:hypothetical protein